MENSFKNNLSHDLDFDLDLRNQNADVVVTLDNTGRLLVTDHAKISDLDFLEVMPLHKYKKTAKAKLAKAKLVAKSPVTLSLPSVKEIIRVKTKINFLNQKLIIARTMSALDFNKCLKVANNQFRMIRDDMNHPKLRIVSDIIIQKNKIINSWKNLNKTLRLAEGFYAKSIAQH